jgi:hypothetical protein
MYRSFLTFKSVLFPVVRLYGEDSGNGDRVVDIWGFVRILATLVLMLARGEIKRHQQASGGRKMSLLNSVHVVSSLQA